jgi:hypothetical protein
MSAVDPREPEEAQTLEAVQRALRLVCVSLPHLSGLAHVVRIGVDARVGTIGIFPSGRLLVNPRWFAALAPGDAAFVVAHELLHLALHTHQRASGTEPRLFNCAHDYIINDMLAQALGRPVPADGLEWPGARELSAESLVQQLRGPGRADGPPTRSWGQTAAPSDTAMAAALRAAGVLGETAADAAAGSDVLDEPLEREWFPQVDAGAQAGARAEVQRAAARAASLGHLRERLEALPRGVPDPEASAVSAVRRALRTFYAPPWDLALQRWMDAVAPGPRSYVRPSRRGADRADVVLAGRRREGWLLHVVVDTSGSMSDELSRILGAIAAYCDGAGVGRVHVLQCDDDVTSDEWVAPEALQVYQVAGFRGSDLSPAMLRLAADPEVEAAIVVTDGEIDYPAGPMPYAVLWALTDADEAFEPGYGQVIALPSPAGAPT